MTTSVISVLLYGAFFAGISAIDGEYTTLQAAKALAGAAAILIGLSFVLSGFCYYWDFLDTKIAYRKYLGLAGYWFALAYSFSLLYLDPDRYYYGFFKNIFSWDMMLGIIAMALFTFMAIISNTRAMKFLGPQNWRYALRVGYIAWLLLAIRAAILEEHIWIAWMKSLEGFPPPRLLLTLFVIVVVLFRASVSLTKYMRRKKKPVPSAINNQVV